MGQRGVMTTHPQLFEYGIHTEVSDIRAHVSVVNKCVYVFETKHGVDAIKNHNPDLRPAFQPGIEYPTAEGWKVKIEWIKDLRSLPCNNWKKWAEMEQAKSTSAKGKYAVDLVVELMKMGRFPLWMDTEEDARENIQIKGTDIVLFCRKKIQVKCDFRSGPLPLGTGNLYLQKSELNPLKAH